MLEPLHLHSIPIWKGHYPGDLSLLQDKALDFLTNSNNLNKGLEDGEAASSSSDPDAPHAWDESADFLKWFYENISVVLENWKFVGGSYSVVNSWVNIHYKTGKTLEHTHSNASLVYAFYIKKPEGSGNIEFFDPLFYHWQGSQQDLGYSWQIADVQEGDVVVFPGWMMHRTEESKTDQPRIVMSGNIGYERT